MGSKIQIKDYEGNELYPITKPEYVIDSTGKSVIDGIQDSLESGESLAVSELRAEFNGKLKEASGIENEHKIDDEELKVLFN